MRTTIETFRCSALPTIALSMALGLNVSLPAAAHDQQGRHGQATVPADAAVPLFGGLGDHTFPITTQSETAQAYFDQGLTFTYGFNHFEAVRSFQEAVRHDDECAMCYWGVALAMGPHINAPMMPEHVAPAYQALQDALAHAPETSEREQAYIEALSHRYSADPPEDRGELDRAYADAMREVTVRLPDDLDAHTVFAESLMNLVPWNYWTEQGEPRAETAELIDALEAVLERDPYHAGANHLYIHAMENSPAPEHAEGAADRLSELNIQIGHMIHMPSHIYARIGRWHDASVANENAIEADRAYLDAYDVEGLVPVLYHPHNIHFLAWTAGMEGRSQRALETSEDLIAATPAELAPQLPFLKNFLLARNLNQVRFGQWDEVLAAPMPDQDSHLMRGMWHFARGMAFAARNELEEARNEQATLTDIIASDEAQALELPEAFLPGATMLQVADATLDGEITLGEERSEEAIDRLRNAVELQDTLAYFEPPYWFTSARLNLGRALLAAEKPAEAEEVYRADLDEYPRNGWALRGLSHALEMQGKTEAAEEVKERFKDAWQHADADFAEGSVEITPR